jgi:hypothetical protein
MRRVVTGLAIGLLGASCSMNSLASNEPTGETPPDARAAIKASLEHPANASDLEQDDGVRERSIFPVNRRVGNVGISSAQIKTLTNLHGWAWETCMRATVDGVDGNYAVFVANGKVVDARTALPVDHCEQQNYIPLSINRPEPPPKSNKGKSKARQEIR